MNIILYTDADVFAGTERHMLDLALGLRDLGENALIACPRPGALAARADDAEVPVLVIPKQGTIDRNAIHVLSRMLASGEADIVHAHNGRTHIAAAAAVRRAGRGKCIFTQHFLAPARTTRTGPKAWIASFLHGQAARSTAQTIAISDAVRNAALLRHDAPPGRITTIHNGIRPPDLSGAPERHYVRSSLGVSPDTPLILCAARLQKEKDIATLIAAMKQVGQSRRDAPEHPVCVIAGDGEQRRALEQQIAQSGVGGTVQLLGFRDDIPALLRACDLFVLPSLAEPFGLVLLEAMALGKPVIATDIGGPREIVQHGATGLLVAPSNPAALAGAMAELLANPDKCRAFGEDGEKRFREHFTADRMARDVLVLYQRSGVLSLSAALPQ